MDSLSERVIQLVLQPVLLLKHRRQRVPQLWEWEQDWMSRSALAPVPPEAVIR